MTAMLTLPPLFEPMVARAAEVMNRVPVIWIEGQSCRGNSEAFLRADAPTVDELLFQVISLEFHQLVMAAAGFQLEQRKAEAMKANYGKYLLVVEGSIPTGYGGGFSTTGAAGTPFIDEVRQLSRGAAAVIAVGACATSAALPAADPNPTGALSTQEVISDRPIVNIPACPMNPANFVGTLLHFTLTGQLPALDSQLRPTWAFGARVHDNCERRAHFDAGEYVAAVGGRERQEQLLPVQDGLQGADDVQQLPDRPVQRRDELAGRRRSRLHRLLRAQLLGQVRVRAAAGHGQCQRSGPVRVGRREQRRQVRVGAADAGGGGDRSPRGRVRGLALPVPRGAPGDGAGCVTAEQDATRAVSVDRDSAGASGGRVRA